MASAATLTATSGIPISAVELYPSPEDMVAPPISAAMALPTLNEI